MFPAIYLTCQGSISSQRGKRPPCAISAQLRNTRQTSRRSSSILWSRLTWLILQ